MLMANYAMGLVISGIAAVSSLAWTYSEVEDVQAMGTGNYMRNIADATNTYTFEAFTTLAQSPTGPTNLTVGGKTIAVQNPLHPTVQDLVNFGLLPIGYSTVSPLGLSFRIDLTPTNCAGDISSCSIPGLVYSTAGYRDAMGRVRTDLMGAAVAKAGQDAGVSFAETPGTITGMAASWSSPNPVAGQPTGVLAMRTGSSSLLAQSMNQFYKRDGSLNLTGPMDANNQAMNRVGNFQSNGSVSANGNVAAGNAVSGNSVVGNFVQSNGNASVGGYVSAGQVYTNGVQSYGNVLASGSVQANGAVTSAGAIVPTSDWSQKVWAGWACYDPQGAIRSDPNGKTLSCQNGVWQPAGGASQGQIVSFWTRGHDVFTDYGVCITWPGSTGMPGSDYPCPPGSVGFIGGTYNTSGSGGG